MVALAVDVVLGEAAEQLEREVLVEVIAKRQRRNDLGADIGVGAGDHRAAGAHRRVGLRIDHGRKHPHLEVPVVAAGRGGKHPADHAKPHAQGGQGAACQSWSSQVPLLPQALPLAIISAHSWDWPLLDQSAVRVALLTGVRPARIAPRLLREGHGFS